MKHPKVNIQLENGEITSAQAPIIISASRATDIPAFYAEWFFNRLRNGYVKWRNPFNGVNSYISFENTRFIVFWSKNPVPLLPYLPLLDEINIGCYIQYTLNDYEHDRLEPNVPELNHRIEMFKQLVKQLGTGSVVWRFDPLMLIDGVGIDGLLSKITSIGDKLLGYAEKLVFSFADISSYRKVAFNLKHYGIKYKEWEKVEMIEFCSRLSEINRTRWGYTLATCAEGIELQHLGIKHNQCIDPILISRLRKNDYLLNNFLSSAKRDMGQRKYCGCIISKDIGAYNTCTHGCRYCYANSSPNTAIFNQLRHNTFSETIV